MAIAAVARPLPEIGWRTTEELNRPHRQQFFIAAARQHDDAIRPWPNPWSTL
jgi:hypothetical protein